MQNGKIGGFKLMRGVTHFQGPADNSVDIDASVELTAQLVPTQDLSILKRAIENAKTKLGMVDFEDYKIQLLDDDGSPILTPMLPLEKIDSEDARYSRRVVFTDFTTDLSQCYIQISREIVSRQIKIIGKKDYWD